MRKVRTPLLIWIPPTLALGLVALGGCRNLDTEVKQSILEKGSFDSEEPRVYTTGDVRIVVRRHHPLTNQWVSCTEPSPDIAKALSSASELSAKGGTTNVNAQVALQGSTAEAIAELAGRSTALLALRDGLFRTCEAYLNGAIGSDAYGLVLTKYGELMTTLFLAEDIRGAVAGAAVASSPTPAQLAANTDASSSAPNATAGGSNGANSSGPVAKSKRQSLLSAPMSGLLKVADPPSPPPAVPSMQAATPSAIASSAPDSSAPTASVKHGSTTTKPGNNPQPLPASSAPASPSVAAALSLVRMEEDYRDLDNDFMHQLLVACIYEYDPTRVRQWVADRRTDPRSNEGQQVAQLNAQKIAIQALESRLDALKVQVDTLHAVNGSAPAPTSTIPPSTSDNWENPWLRQLCPSLANFATLVSLAQQLLPAINSSGHPAPDVNPELATGNVTESAGASNATSSAPPNKPPTPAAAHKTQQQKPRSPAAGPPGAPVARDNAHGPEGQS
jgi:hypothetical protein